MTITFRTKAHDNTQQKARVVLTDSEISRRLGISKKAARALIETVSGGERRFLAGL